MHAENELLGAGRRAELADFLRRRRNELTTDMVGLPATRRRRTPGLRREEVAELAGISTALYAWLEQARDVPISRRTVEAIAVALSFAPSEREHMYALATHQTSELHEVVSPTLLRMVASLRSHPIFVIDHKWDVVHYNHAAHVIFNYNGAKMTGVNLLEVSFDVGRTLFVNWLEVAGSIVELYRYDYSVYAGDAAALALVERLRATDPDFAAIWSEHRVRRSPSNVRELRHPVAGILSIEPSIYAVVESPGLRCMLYTPSDDATARRIDELVGAHVAGAQGSAGAANGR